MFDTHCHIQGSLFSGDADAALAAAANAGVSRCLIVGTDLPESERAVAFVQERENCWATIGLHPHEGSIYADDEASLQRFAALVKQPKVVGIGECGLDYYYNHSPAEKQKKLLRFQLELALKNDLALVFHVRDAFDDFFAIFDEYHSEDAPLRGVVHSFTATQHELEGVLKRGLLVGLNGIMTFTKSEAQLAAAKAVPTDRLLLETDAPFLTPVPKRGSMNEPKNIVLIAEFLAGLRQQSVEEIAAKTTANAQQLFRI